MRPLPLNECGHKSDGTSGRNEIQKHLQMVGLMGCVRDEPCLTTRLENNIVIDGHVLARRQNK